MKRPNYALDAPPGHGNNRKLTTIEGSDAGGLGKPEAIGRLDGPDDLQASEGRRAGTHPTSGRQGGEVDDSWTPK
jgi:hypothetical protein